jgi:hypothetical protein
MVQQEDTLGWDPHIGFHPNISFCCTIVCVGPTPICLLVVLLLYSKSARIISALLSFLSSVDSLPRHHLLFFLLLFFFLPSRLIRSSHHNMSPPIFLHLPFSPPSSHAPGQTERERERERTRECGSGFGPWVVRFSEPWWLGHRRGMEVAAGL